jgi:hypothetical protein
MKHEEYLYFKLAKLVSKHKVQYFREGSAIAVFRNLDSDFFSIWAK